METWDGFWEWAWARHHNILSWYVRPLFLVPYCYSAYRKSLWGILGTLLALATSMFWFPAPAEPSPAVIEALQAERDYLAGPWPIWKILIALLIPITLTALALAFWRRSFWWGLAVLNGMTLFKIFWTMVFFPTDSILAHMVPALSGLLICDALLIWFYRRHVSHVERTLTRTIP